MIGCIARCRNNNNDVDTNELIGGSTDVKQGIKARVILDSSELLLGAVIRPPLRP